MLRLLVVLVFVSGVLGQEEDDLPDFTFFPEYESNRDIRSANTTLTPTNTTTEAPVETTLPPLPPTNTTTAPPVRAAAAGDKTSSSSSTASSSFSTPTAPLTSLPLQTSVKPPNKSPKKGTASGISRPVIIAVIVTVVLVAVLLVILGVVYWRRREGGYQHIKQDVEMTENVYN